MLAPSLERKATDMKRFPACLAAVVILAGWMGAVESAAAGAEMRLVVQPRSAGTEVPVQELIERIAPGRAKDFVVEFIPPHEGKDVFEIESRGGKIVLRGNSPLSAAFGLKWYLKHYCRRQVSLDAKQLVLPDPLPGVEPKLRRTAWAKYRYFMNYCCFGYSLPWWDWEQWEKLIDWMALNGVNLPLSVTGEEAVWQAVCRRLGMSDAETAGFFAGPPYLPFQWMGCLDGWGGPLPADWCKRHEELQKKILARQRELGMTPVLQGFTGHVPAALRQKFPNAKLHSIQWIEWKTYLLDPLDPLFEKVARMWMEEQSARYGSSHVYAADTFIEMAPPSGDLEYLDRLGKAIYRGMASHDPQAVWLLQTWIFLNQSRFWTQDRIRAFLDSVPNESMLCLDLYCERTPQWQRTEAFCGKPWLWCNIQNFGNTVFLGGALNKMTADLPAARRDPKGGHLAGLGFVNEGLGYNPVAFDLMFEMAWREEPVDLNGWFAGYAQSRYGRSNDRAECAWAILKDAVYQAPNRMRSVFAAVPILNPGKRADYRLAEAWRLLLDAAGELGQSDAFRYDLVNVARQVLSNHASDLHRAVAAAYQAKDLPALEDASRQYLQMMLDIDELLLSRREFLLGRWLEDAKRWGRTDAEKAVMQWNARRVLTRWGASRRLNDYARKEWSGMVGGYYHERWKIFLDALAGALKSGNAFPAAAVEQRLIQWEDAWSRKTETYPSEPVGDSVAVAKKLWGKYGKDFEPEVSSLTTGKPVACSHALTPYPARLANDGGNKNTERYWATDTEKSPGPAWWQVDLEKETDVGRVVVVGYYGDQRYYGFTVETSLDGKNWKMAADRRDNREPSTKAGYTCKFEPVKARYIRITMTANSANTGRHLVEVMAYEK